MPRKNKSKTVPIEIWVVALDGDNIGTESEAFLTKTEAEEYLIWRFVEPDLPRVRPDVRKTIKALIKAKQYDQALDMWSDYISPYLTWLISDHTLDYPVDRLNLPK